MRILLLPENSIKLIRRVTFIILHLIRDSNELTLGFWQFSRFDNAQTLPGWPVLYVATGSQCFFHHSMSSFFIRVHFLRIKTQFPSPAESEAGARSQPTEGIQIRRWFLFNFRNRLSMISFWHSRQNKKRWLLILAFIELFTFTWTLSMKPGLVSVLITHMTYF